LNNNRDGETESRVLHANVSEGETLDAGITAATTAVSGKIVPADSVAALQGTVSLAGKDGRFLTKTIEKDGTFAFPRVEVGTYEVQVNLGSEGDYIQEVTAAGAKVVEEQVEIKDTDDEVQLLVRLGHGFGQIKGVVQANDKSRPGAMVLLVPTFSDNLEKYSRTDQSDSDGSFTLGGILPGKYLLMALDDWDLDWQDPEILAPYRAKAQSVAIAPNETKTMQTQLLTTNISAQSTR
jgi:hypothetical protein